MSWKECTPMDELIQFVARLLEGEKFWWCAGSSASRGSPATSSSIAIRPATYRA